MSGSNGALQAMYTPEFCDWLKSVIASGNAPLLHAVQSQAQIAEATLQAAQAQAKATEAQIKVANEQAQATQATLIKVANEQAQATQATLQAVQEKLTNAVMIIESSDRARLLQDYQR